MSAEVYVFDLGGVLCEFSTERRLVALSAASGLEPADVRRRLEDSQVIDLADRGDLTREKEYQRATTALGLSCVYPTYRALWCSAFTPDPEVIEIARMLRAHHHTALLTNNGPVLLDALSHDLDIVGREFEHLFVSAMFGATKPSEAVFLGVVRALSVPPAQLCLIDDSPANVDGARQVGWRGIHFTSSAQLRDALADDLQITS
jgi:HAD superfamily hydrolase (TIGR01509 family)